jgi:hypothetical protein
VHQATGLAETPTATGSQTGPAATLVVVPRLKRLTAAEMTAKHERGECYNYTEKFKKEHLEVCPMKCIFLLELDTPKPINPLDDATPQISLNAITGIFIAETMKLLVHLCDSTVTTLIDSGLTHSFISIEAACRLHLEPLFHSGLLVTMANGDRVASAGIYQNVKFCIDSKEFVLDFFTIPLAGYEMVLSA